MSQVTVPNEALKYILLQRTAYQHFTKTFACRALSRVFPSLADRCAVAMEARLKPARIRALYEDDMEKEYLSIRDHLPAACASILDIGCGVAGIDVFLARHYLNAPPVFYLLDKTRMERSVFYGFKPRGAFYNSLDVAKSLLVRNGVPEKNIHLAPATDDNDIAVSRPVDLIISLISWGFHYPVETYLDKAHAVLADKGSLILDVRTGTNGIEALKSKFVEVQIVCAGKNYQRVLASK